MDGCGNLRGSVYWVTHRVHGCLLLDVKTQGLLRNDDHGLFKYEIMCALLSEHAEQPRRDADCLTQKTYTALFPR